MALVKKLLSIVVLVLAVNFLLALGAIGYVVASAGVNQEKVGKIKDVLYPPAEAPEAPAAPVTEQKVEPTIDPTKRIEELLAKSASVTAAEQVQFLRQAFDVQMAELDRRERELQDLQRQIELAKDELSTGRASLAQEKKALAERETRSSRLEQDAGFQTSLALYLSMPAKQVKDVFMDKSDEDVAAFLAAMPPRAASKIVKEFSKTEAEKRKVASVLTVLRGKPDVDSSVLNSAAEPTASVGGAGKGGDQ